ncbi:hypothetical protein EDM68_01545 [Candidatus Uhrbacteria bacterium]|nr:MAG: hypothetical protein EDM68_01545 [Candidatus Uhrbacteria bacterium]
MSIQHLALIIAVLSGLCVIVGRILLILILRKLRDVVHRYDRNLNATFASDELDDGKFVAFARAARKHEEAERLVSEWIRDSSETTFYLSWELFRPALYWSVIGMAFAVVGVFLSRWLSLCALPVLCLNLLAFWQAVGLGRSWWRQLGAFAEKLDDQYALWECPLPSESHSSNDEAEPASHAHSDPGPQTP